jgi:hypothetical protein
MSDRITSKDGKYEGVLETDGNFVVHRTADGWPIAALGADISDPVKSEPEPATLPLPPEPNQRKFFIVAAIVVFGLPLLGFLVGTFVF